MKKLHMMFALVGVLLLAVGCEKKVNVAFTSSSVQFPAEGDEVWVSVTSNGDWTVDSYPDWLTVSQSGGTGNEQIRIAASANDSGAERSGEVKVSSKDNTATLTVTQTFVEKYLRLTPDSYVIDRFGGSFEINVESNVAWTLSGLTDWVSASATEGSNNGRILVEVASIDGELSEGRQAVLTVAGDGLEALFVVVQSHETNHVFNVNPSVVESLCEGGTATLSVTSTVPWTASTQVDWITISPNSGEGNAEVTVNVAENTELVGREESIQFVCTYPGGSTGSAVVSVRQEAAPDPHFLTVDPAELSFGNEGGMAEIAVGCDVEWNIVEFEPAWVTLSAMSGSGSGTLAVSAEPNTITEPRSLSFSIVSGELLRRVVVSQEAGEEPPTVMLSPDTLSVSNAGGVLNLTVTSNVMWTLEASDSWMLLSTHSGEGDATVGVVFDLNSSETTRYGSIKSFYNGQLMDETIVVQEGKPNIFETDITEINAAPEGGEYVIQLTANQSWTIEKGATWMSINPLSGTGDCEIVVKVEGMMSMLPRTAEIYINGSLGRMIIISVTQSH